MSFVTKPHAFRRIVDGIPKQRDATLIKAIYLTASRVSEITSHAVPYDLRHNKSKPYGRYLTWELSDYEDERVLVMNFAVAKRKPRGKNGEPVRKIIALPCDPKYEPWTLGLLKRIQKRGTLCFNLSRNRVRQIVKSRLGYLDPEIHTHSLRHYRITHLVTEYGFDPYDLTAYAGWTFRTGLGTVGMGSGQLDVYLHLAWQKYFPKLLKET